MNISLQNKYYNLDSFNQPRQTMTFQGKSRDLERVLDSVINKTEINDAEKNLIIEKIKTALVDILSPKRFIEKGSHNSVYKITKKYVARVPNKSHVTKDNIGDNFEWGKNVFKSLQNYCGEPIMKLGKLQILPNAGGQIPAGVPEHLTNYLSKNKIKKYYLEKYLPIFARVPQKEYDNFALTLQALNKMRFGNRLYGLFDSKNPNNLLLSKGKLILVDEIYTLCDKSCANTITRMLEIFVMNATRNIKSPEPGKHIKQMRKIFEKVLLSGTKGDLLIVDSRDECKIFEAALRKCKINDPLGDVLYELDQIVRKESNIDERVKLTKQYLKKLFNTNPTNK